MLYAIIRHHINTPSLKQTVLIFPATNAEEKEVAEINNFKVLKVKCTEQDLLRQDGKWDGQSYGTI